MVDNSTTHYQWRIQGEGLKGWSPPWQPYWILFLLNNWWMLRPITLKLTECIWPLKGKVPFENHHLTFFNMATMAAILNFVPLNNVWMFRLVTLKLTGCIKGKVNFENHHRSFFNMATMAAVLNFVPLNNVWMLRPITLKATGYTWPIKGKYPSKISIAAFSIWPPWQPYWILFLLNN